jgi:hypothetical protein
MALKKKNPFDKGNRKKRRSPSHTKMMRSIRKIKPADIRRTWNKIKKMEFEGPTVGSFIEMNSPGVYLHPKNRSL